MRRRIKEVVARVVELDPDQVPDQARSEELPGWDSLRQLELMLELEREFGVHVSTETMLELTSLAEIEAFLARSSST